MQSQFECKVDTTYITLTSEFIKQQLMPHFELILEEHLKAAYLDRKPFDVLHLKVSLNTTIENDYYKRLQLK